MRLDRSLAWVVLTVAVGSGWGPPQKADRPADIALKEKGLTKTGTVYTIEDEKPVLARMKEARTGYQAFAAMSSQQSMHEELARKGAQLEDQRAELQSQLEEINQRIGEMAAGPGNQGPPGGRGGPGGTGNQASVSPLTIERDQLKNALAEVTAQQRTVKNTLLPAKDVAAMDAKVKKAEETLKGILTDLRTQVDAVTKKYSDLGEDGDVRKLLAEAKQGNPKLRLGPSDAFAGGNKELAKAEQQFLGKRTSVVSTKKKAKSKK